MISAKQKKKIKITLTTLAATCFAHITKSNQIETNKLKNNKPNYRQLISGICSRSFFLRLACVSEVVLVEKRPPSPLAIKKK